MSTTTQFVVLFIGAVSILFALGFFAVWAEFNSSAKKGEYTRYKHFETFSFDKQNEWLSKIKHRATYGQVDSNGFAIFNPA